MSTINRDGVTDFIDGLRVQDGNYTVSKSVTREMLDLDAEPEIQTDRDAVKIVACRECKRPLVVTTFFAPAKGICRICKGDDTSGVATVGQPTPGETDPAKAVNLADALINRHFAFAVCPVHPDDPTVHEMELKSISHSDFHGPSELIGYKNGRPEYRQTAKGETVMHQCLHCKAVVTYSTTAVSQFQRVNEIGQNNKNANRWGDTLGIRDEAKDEVTA